MDDFGVASSIEKHLQHRQFLVQGAKADIARAREAREGKARYRAGQELAGAGAPGSAINLDEARRKRVMLSMARPGKTIPATAAMSDRQLARMPRSGFDR